jgi:hypothetical protein
MSRLPLRVHAIYSVLDDAPLFRASVRSIYDHVDGITVITTHDRDWHGRPRDADELVALILSRELDPQHKIELAVVNETNEARSRNRAMDLAAPRSESLRVRQQHQSDTPHEIPDYFLIVDADEIYEAEALTRLKAYAARCRRPFYRVACIRYFKRWNYRIDGLEWMVALVRADRRLPYLRLRRTNVVRRAAARVPRLPDGIRIALRGFEDVPPEVAVFHHGSYVGPRRRIKAKLESFGHSAEVAPGWLEDVWDTWTPDRRDFNPAYPTLFSRAERVDATALPAEIVEHAWPAGYLDS